MRGLNGLAVDVAGDHRLAENLRRRNRQHTGAGADVEHAPRTALLGQSVERRQAAARGAVVASAEGKRSLDLNADGIGGNTGAIMRAMHNKAAHAHGFEARKALRHPIDFRDALENELSRGCFARRVRDQCAHRGLLDAGAEMDRDLPLSAIAREGGIDNVATDRALVDDRSESPCSRFVASNTGNIGWGIGHITPKFALRIYARNGYPGAMSLDTPSSRDNDVLALARRNGWPDDLCVLLARYPREQWQGHANLGGMARFWLSRHGMFRELAAMIQQIETQFRSGTLPPAEFAVSLVPRLQFLLSQLEVHHQIEDYHYFPIFRVADERLARGFDVLEDDHHAIHSGMARAAETTNALLRALQGDADMLRRRRDDYASASGALIKGLIRHLNDEEDLIVPLILDRGEQALGVGH